ncbi:hypothetical protein SK128_007628, partial [Halocaridina rubra]
MRLWFKQIKELRLDFKVDDSDVMSIIHQQLHQPYNMKKGPLWRARLVPIQKQSSSDPHRSALTISVHHCITDGYTNMKICRNILEVLNASLTGRIQELLESPVFPAATDTLMTIGDW